jgi:hypothetical protein
VREWKSVRGANRDNGAGNRESSQAFRRTQPFQGRFTGRGCNQLKATEMDEALDARGHLARVCSVGRCRSVVVPGVRVLRLSGAAPGHRSPGNRAQRK